MDDATFDRMKQAQMRYHAEAMSIPGVHGTSIGLKHVGGRPTEVYAIRIHLTRKKPLDEVPLAERIPAEIDGFPTDVEEHDQPKPYEDNAKRRPVLGGIQIVTEDGFTHRYGTLGCIVKDKKGSSMCALSNQHVFVREGLHICQPKVDACDLIGFTKRTIISENVDGAICSLDRNDVRWDASIVDIGPVKGTYVVQWSDRNYRVKKRGRTTRLTTGLITSISYSGDRTDGWKFKDQHFIKADSGNFAEAGDSGSVVVDNSSRVVGLLWGGGSGFGAASPIDLVLAQLDIEMTTSLEAGDQIAYGETTVGKLESWLGESARGQAYWSVFRRYADRVRHSFHDTPRLYAAWRKAPAIDLLEALHAAAADPDSKIPSTIGGQDTLDVVSELQGALARHLGDPELDRHISSLQADLRAGIGRSWREALSD